eukprot:4071772-Alexandrium_andersonii.AAC.1
MERLTSHRSYLPCLPWADRHDVCTGAPFPAQPDATFPTGIQAVLRFRRPRPIVHQLSKFVA